MGGKRVVIEEGVVYGKLTALGGSTKPHHTLFMCVCGEIVERGNSSVNGSKNYSCGKCPRVWVAGQRFGKWTATTPLPESSGKGGGVLWNVVCDCGVEAVRGSRSLRIGETTHCGCSPVPRKPKDITGKKLNKLTATSTTGNKCSNGDYLWNFKCDCGGTTVTSIGRFNSGHTTSCGCAIKETAKKKDNYHGMNKTGTYNSWRKMRERCNNPRDPLYDSYGGAGIKVCTEWDNGFKGFYKDMGDAPEGFTIDRIDNKKGYEKGNCRWASKYTQGRNRGSNVGTSKYKGVQYEESSGKWVATITVGKYLCKKIGRYKEEDHAAQAYNYASEAIFGKGDSRISINDLEEDYSVVNLNCKFFNCWVWKMKDLAEELYEKHD